TERFRWPRPPFGTGGARHGGTRGNSAPRPTRTVQSRVDSRHETGGRASETGPDHDRGSRTARTRNRPHERSPGAIAIVRASRRHAAQRRAARLPYRLPARRTPGGPVGSNRKIAGRGDSVLEPPRRCIFRLEPVGEPRARRRGNALGAESGGERARLGSVKGYLASHGSRKL